MVEASDFTREMLALIETAVNFADRGDVRHRQLADQAAQRVCGRNRSFLETAGARRHSSW